MNRKIIIPLAVLAVILPAVGVMSMETFDNSTDRIIGHMQASSKGLTLPELVTSSDLTIEGTIISTHTETKILEGDTPVVFTIAKVRVNEVLSGNTSEKIVTVKMFGGIDGKYETIVDRLSMSENDQVIMILFEDPDAEYLGGNYGLASMSDSIFKKVGADAKSYSESKSIPYDELKNAIKTITT